MVYPKIDPVILSDEGGYWLASYNWGMKELTVFNYYFQIYSPNRTTNAAQKAVRSLRASGLGRTKMSKESE